MGKALKADGWKIWSRRIQPAHLAAAGSLVAGLLLLPVSSCASIAVWSAFVVLALLAPFFPSLGFYLPVASRNPVAAPKVALTFDDGPWPATTPGLLKVLAQRGVKATFFMVGRQVRLHPELVREVLAKGHEIGNHSDSHDHFLMLKTASRVAREIEGCSTALRNCGIETAVFRPPVGITNPALGGILERTGLVCVQFSCRGGDAGNRRLNKLAKRIIAHVRGGDILLMHDCPPRDERDIELWLKEVETVLDGLERKGLSPVLLSELTGLSVMKKVEHGENKG